MNWAIRSPDHLGDGIMAIPSISALSTLGIEHLVGPSWCKELYPSFKLIPPDRYWSTPGEQQQNIILFKPSFGSAWRSRRHKRRVGLTGNGRKWLLTDPIVPGNEHRISRYNRIAMHFGLEPDSKPEFSFSSRPHPHLNDTDVLLIVGTKSPNTVRWKGFRELANLLGERAVIGGGPGDELAVAEIGMNHRKLPTNLSIDAFASASAHVSMVVGTDSGLTHLATASRHWAGRDSNSVTVIYGSTDPERTGPKAHGIWSKRPSCWPCYAKSCKLDLACMRLSPQQVLERLS